MICIDWKGGLVVRKQVLLLVLFGLILLGAAGVSVAQLSVRASLPLACHSRCTQDSDCEGPCPHCPYGICVATP
jgi:hypothetical protein